MSAWLNVSIDSLVGTDQKAEAFWDLIQQYCEEDNPGVIKKGIVGIKKRWQRINEGAQKYGACFEKAQKQVGSGSKLNNVIDRAHLLHTDTYNKKSNFESQYFEIRRQLKWRTPSTTESWKKIKLNNSGAYLSSGNNDTPKSENVVESPVRPMRVKATKRKGKGKARTVEVVDEYEALNASAYGKLNLMEVLNDTKQIEMNLQVIFTDTTKMNDAQRKAHSKLLEKIMARN